MYAFHRTIIPFRHLDIPQSLRKHAYSNILRILPSKNENFQIKNSDIVLISAQNMDCGYSLEPPRRGGCNEYPQSMLLRRNKKNNVYPCKPEFYYIKVGLRGSKLYWYVFVMIPQYKSVEWLSSQKILLSIKIAGWILLLLGFSLYHFLQRHHLTIKYFYPRLFSHNMQY